MSEPPDADPFGTEAVRDRVVAGWAASPARFREDANAEEDLVHGAYRDRLLVELAQNAADAATRAGVPGELRLSLVDGELRAANTGAPLDAAGVEALATLRASAKRDGGTVGRFGVGFAAVLTVTDEPVVRSTTGGVRFSAVDTLDVVAAVPALAAELDRRGGRVPVLRLPWPASGAPPAGADTEVRLPLRPGADPDVRAALARLDPVLLLALPGLRSVDVDGRALSRVDRPDGTVVLRDGPYAVLWRLRTATGTVPADLLTGRPVEERERPEWTVTWAVPVDSAGVPVPPPRRPVVHAPTPTDEPLSLPAVLLAGFPLGSDRRHVTPGPVTDLLVREAAEAYAGLVAELPPVPAVLALVPRPALAGAELDAALSGAVLDALSRTPWLPLAAPAPPPDPAAALPDSTAVRPDSAAALPDSAGGAGSAAAVDPVAVSVSADPVARASGEGPAGRAAGIAAAAVSAAGRLPGSGQGAVAAGPERVAPADAVVVDSAPAELIARLADLLPGLLPAEWSGRGQAAALGALGVRRLSTADVVELLSGVDRPPAWWRGVYAALSDLPDREALAALPVPLAGGRTVTGVRGTLLPDADLPAEAASALGLRVVHPEAAHPVLERLGAVPATAHGVLADERVRAAVEASADEEDPAPVADAVLALVAGAHPAPGELPWLAGLVLPDEDGDWSEAGTLLLPGSPLARVLQEDAPFGLVDAEVLDRWGAETLAAVGVLATFELLRVEDVELDPDEAAYDLDAVEAWMESVLDRLPPQPLPPRLDRLVAVRDLDLVRPDAWDEALPLMAALPGIGPTATATLADGTQTEVPSYTTWWLSTRRTLGGERPDRLRIPAAADLAGLYDEAPGEPALHALAGVLRGLEDVLADPDRAEELLHRLADPHRAVPGPTLRDVYARLAPVLDGGDPEPPARVRVAPERTVDRDRAVVLDAPHLLPLLGGRVPVPTGSAPGPVADLLDLPLATELVDAVPTSTVLRRLAWSDVPGAALAAERVGAAPPDATVAVHDGLRVGDTAVRWWAEAGTDHVDEAAGPAALGRALAWRLGTWDRRAALTEALADPDAADRLRAEDAAG